MAWLQTIDTALFRFINQSLTNPVFDWLMPLLAGHSLFAPLVALAAVAIVWRGGRRGRLFVIFLVLAVALGDTLVCKTIKEAVGRPRPFVTLPDARVLVGYGLSGSMPSSHAANWFAATMIAFFFYRRSWRFMLPMACAVGFSRVYDGVHYPSDVVAGAVLGAGYAAAMVSLAEIAWGAGGRRWFPLWWAKQPSLVFFAEAHPTQAPPGETSSVAEAGTRTAPSPLMEQHWLRLGYALIGALFLFRLAYIGSSTISLSKDEAYQWLWSKHLALSYYSKPPGIALIQYAGTSLWGDTQFGVRFFSPVFAAILSVVLLRFMARTVNARAGFLLLLMVTATPLMGIGTILMTIDPPLVLCWCLAMVAGWRAVQENGTTKDWAGVGLAMGLGFLSKYNAAFQVVCGGLFFLLWPPARVHLRKPGPYLAVLILLLCTTPVVIWNSQNNWVTASHVAWNAALGKAWKPTLRYFWDFMGAQAGLLNPVFLIGSLWAMVGLWKYRRERPLWVYLFCMGAPIFLGHWAYSLHSRILPNWIAPSVLPMFCLMAAYWDARWQAGARAVKPCLWLGVVVGLIAVGLAHESKVIGKIAGRPLPAEKDPLRRVRAWKETTACVESARQRLLHEGQPTFIISDHYGMAGLFTFYLPEARAALRTKPLVYYQTSTNADNQLYFWPEYRYREHRSGENAIYVTELDPYPLETGWLWRWLTGKPVRYDAVPRPIPAPQGLRNEFESVTDLGIQEIKLGDRVFRRVRLYECRNLR